MLNDRLVYGVRRNGTRISVRGVPRNSELKGGLSGDPQGTTYYLEKALCCVQLSLHSFFCSRLKDIFYFFSNTLT